MRTESQSDRHQARLIMLAILAELHGRLGMAQKLAEASAPYPPLLAPPDAWRPPDAPRPAD